MVFPIHISISKQSHTHTHTHTIYIYIYIYIKQIYPCLPIVASSYLQHHSFTCVPCPTTTTLSRVWFPPVLVVNTASDLELVTDNDSARPNVPTHSSQEYSSRSIHCNDSPSLVGCGEHCSSNNSDGWWCD